MKLNLGAGVHPLEGFVNFDLAGGWRFEDGLPEYPDGSVDAITISHALMYVALEDWPAVFAEFARVLRSGGVLRVTEDATDDPASERYGGFPGAVTLTSLSLVAAQMFTAGLRPAPMAATSTLYRDDSLLQDWHGGSPKCFFVEGVKP